MFLHHQSGYTKKHPSFWYVLKKLAVYIYTQHNILTSTNSFPIMKILRIKKRKTYIRKAMQLSGVYLLCKM